MSSLPSLPRVLSQRRANSLEVERENFVKSQGISLSKAINNQETPVKEKHVRNAIIGTFHEKGANTFWDIVMKIPLQGQPIICWKFCHVLHKLLREGHKNVMPDSYKYRSSLVDLGKLWGHLQESYGKLIRNYCNLLVAKLDFHKRNPRFPGNLNVTDEQLEDIGERDINVYFQLTCEMFDYMDEILTLQAAVFGSLDMSRSNSMTSSGQCRLSPLIPCIQDSSQLYDYCVKLLFKLHSSLPPDTLVGHRERFKCQFKGLRQFYLSSSNLQYFKYLIQVPLLPENPPNFLIASDLSAHVSPVVILPPQCETPENEAVDGTLVDTTTPEPSHSPSHFDEMFGTGDFEFKDQNGSLSPDPLAEKERLIERLLQEIEELKMEIQRIKIEDQRVIDDLNREISALESQIAEYERTFEELRKENESLKLSANATLEKEEAVAKLSEAEKKAKTQEEKFLKMKEVYNKLREEHISLIRAKADVEKHLSSARNMVDEAKKNNQELKQTLEVLKSEKTVAEEKLQQSADLSSEELAAVTANKVDLETIVDKLKVDLLKLENEQESLQKQVEKLLEENRLLTASEEEHKARVQSLWQDHVDKHRQLFVNLVGEAEHIIQTTLEEFDNPSLASVTCAPEYLLHQTEPTKVSLQKMEKGYDIYLQDPVDMKELIQSLNFFSHQLAALLLHGKATSHASPNIEDGDELASVCRHLGMDTLDLFRTMKEQGSEDIVPDKILQVRSGIEKISSLTEGLVPNMSTEDPHKLGDMVVVELGEMDKVIEEAAKIIEDLLSRTKSEDTGIKVEVNGKILDSCIGLMQAIKVLVKSSKELQNEIVSQGKGSATDKEFYNRNHRWTEGLISAAKVVGMAAKFLVDAADKVVSGEGKFEELMVASQEIAAATAQLVVASKVKAERGSEKLSNLSRASRGVSEATGIVVATSKSCAELVEESEVMDFSKLSLHQAKRLEMDSQVRVLELENDLQKERMKLAALRKRHYHLAGASEGWEEEDIPK